MASSYNAPYSFPSNPGFGSGWTNLSDYVTKSNIDQVSGLKEEPLWQPMGADSPYNDMNAANFDAWLFGMRPNATPQNPYEAPPLDNTGTGTAANTGGTGVVLDKADKKQQILEERLRRAGGRGMPRAYMP